MPLCQNPLCRHAGEDLPLSAFKPRKIKRGYSQPCRECWNEKSRKKYYKPVPKEIVIHEGGFIAILTLYPWSVANFLKETYGKCEKRVHEIHTDEDRANEHRLGRKTGITTANTKNKFDGIGSN